MKAMSQGAPKKDPRIKMTDFSGVGFRPPRSDNPGSSEPPLPLWVKVVLWCLLAAGVAVVMTLLAREDIAYRKLRRAEILRRTEQCERLGGLPRYQSRGYSYDGCDFPPEAR